MRESDTFVCFGVVLLTRAALNWVAGTAPMTPADLATMGLSCFILAFGVALYRRFKMRPR